MTTGGRQAHAGQREPRVLALILTHEPLPALVGTGAGRSPSLEVAMVGWVMSHDSVDAAVPADVQRILATALCRTGRVTFLDSSVEVAPGLPWQAVPGGFARVLAPARFQALMRRPAFALRCTQQPELARQLFGEPAFPWLQGGQLAFVSQVERAPLELEYALVDAAFDWSRVEEVFAATKDSLLALMRPGADGDFAHLAVRGQEGTVLWDRLLESCTEMSIPLRVVDGPEFIRTRWIAPAD